MHAKKQFPWWLSLCLLIITSRGQAQCITLDQLLDLSALGAEPPVQRVARQLPTTDWTYQGAGKLSKEVYWTYKDPQDDYVAPDGNPEAWLSVRPTPTTQVVTMKTAFPACVNQIRASLRLLKPKQTPITCLECEATRYESQQFIIDIYDRKKGPYPFIVVLRQMPGGVVPKAATTSVSKP